MPGGGTPALAPMKLPAFVMEPKPASFAYAGENANAAIPAAASRALLFIFMYPPCGSLKIALPVSRWIQNYLPPLKAQLKDGLPHCVPMVFPACVAKLHTSAKRFDRTRNPFKLLFANNIFVWSRPFQRHISVSRDGAAVGGPWITTAVNDPIRASNRSDEDQRAPSSTIATPLVACIDAIRI